MSGVDPIEHRLSLACPPARAFAAFTHEMGAWWDPAYTPDAAAYTGIDLDPSVGGDVAMLLGEGRYVFGRVTRWEPGRAFAQSFWLAHSPDHPSEVAIDVALGPGGSSVSFRHGGWTPGNESARARYGDWPHLLGRFVAHAHHAG